MTTVSADPTTPAPGTVTPLWAGDPLTANMPAPIPLWDGPAPLGHDPAGQDNPTIRPYLPKGSTGPTPAVVICPGGGYAGLSMVYEGANEATWFAQHGVAAFVLAYRLPAKGYRHPAPMLDAQRAIRFVRARAAQWNLDPRHVGIMGFSAGGHLASTVDTHFDAGNASASDPVDRQSCRPDYAVLVYAVITLEGDKVHAGSKLNLLGPNPSPDLVHSLSNNTQVTAQTPPTLLVAVDDDKTVPVENSRLRVAALQKAGVDSAFQEYPKGGHGFGFGHQPDHSPAGWLDKVGEWLRARGDMP